MLIRYQVGDVNTNSLKILYTGFQQFPENWCVCHDTLNSLDILRECDETKVKQWRAELMPKIVKLIIGIIIIYYL